MDFEPLLNGYHFEGMYPDGDTLWFSDVFDGGIRRRSADGRVDVWLPERRLIGGVLMNADGKVLVSGVGGIVWLDPETGASGTLVDMIHGEPIRGVNEMIPDGAGGIYFGTLDVTSQEQGTEMALGGLYRLEVNGRVSPVYHGIPFPNGIGRSADGSWLYNNSTGIGTFAYDLTATAAEPIELMAKDDCDGIALDVDGGIWVCGYSTGDLLRLTPEGVVREVLPTPAFGISNVRFGGADGMDIYITATSEVVMAEYQSGRPPSVRGSQIMRGRSSVAGLPIPRTQFVLG